MASEFAAHTNRIATVLKDRASAARSALAASWSRSLLQYGLDPEKPHSPQQLSFEEFRDAFGRATPLVHSARETLDRLYHSVREIDCCIVLSDCNGVILDRRVASGAHSEYHDLRRGVVWSEERAGTNGLGTSLQEGRPVTIHREQHFLARNIGMSCTATPIRDAQGRIAGALDVSVVSGLTVSMLKLIQSATCDAAQKIEARYFREVFSGARVVLLSDAASSAAIAIDRHDLVIGANYAARRRLGLTDDDFINPFPASRVLSATHMIPDSLEDAEMGVLKRALSRAGGNVSIASRHLGISRATFHRKLARFRIVAESQK